MSLSRELIRAILCLSAVSCASRLLAEDVSELAVARQMLLTGRYEEAADLYRKRAASEPLSAALGQAACLEATGQLAAAKTVLEEAFCQHGEAAELAAQLARLALRRGDHAAARRYADRAIALNPAQLAARWVTAELHRMGGRLEAAEAGYGWLVEYYEKHQRLSPEQLRWVGLAAAQHARWRRDSNRFRWLVNTLYPAILAEEPDYWPAHLETARLLAEKYNLPDARSHLASALAINPDASPVHAARAQLALQSFDLTTAESHLRRALEIDPCLLAAHQAQADVWLAQLDVARAMETLERALELNPRDEATLGRLAAAYGTADGLQDVAPDSRCGRLIEQVVTRNPHCGRFFETLADSLDRMRKYPAAAKYYREADMRMPRLLYARGKLGLLMMRLGDEQQAAALLEEAFRSDPFHVRIKNTLEVLDVLAGYARIETEHFVIRFDAERETVLAQYASRYLEDIHAELVELLGYEPPGKSLFEIFSRARNTSGHGWFSARMVGLPFVGSVAACAGRVVAIASPNDMPQPYAWARTLKHEFVHVVTIQQTHFNIPHWFTEALAVRLEEVPRPASWNEILLRRAAQDALLDLDSINLAFVRPRDSDEWALAYCQAELYADFMVRQHGVASLRKLLEAYRDNLTTPEAIHRCFQVDIAEFERGYRDYVRDVARDLADGVIRLPRGLDELKQAVRDDPRNADRWAELGEAYLRESDEGSARKCSGVARRLAEQHPLASYVLARLSLADGDRSRATELLEEALDETAPHADALALLAALAEQRGDATEAERLYRLGHQRFAWQPRWSESLARIYLRSGEHRKLAETLELLAILEENNFVIRKKLLELHLDAGDPDKAVRWGTEAYQIDVMDSEVHAMLGRALRERQQCAPACEHLATAVDLAPERVPWQVELADWYVQAGDRRRAVRTLEQLLRRHPGHARARDLLKQIGAAPDD